MIISSAPLRISFAGGGSDLPAFYQRKRGAVLSTTINRYIYICIHPYFDRAQTLLKYSQTEKVTNFDQIHHPIFRCVLNDLRPKEGLEIVSTSDIPSGTGLGSSSSFTVALLHALYAHQGVFCSKEMLAQKACETEIEKLGEPIGKQDQYAAAYGGLNFIEFNPDGNVVVTPLILPKDTITSLENNLILFYTGDQRKTSQILRDQSEQLKVDIQKFKNLEAMTVLAYDMRERLIAGDLPGFAEILHRGWELKKTLSKQITNSWLENIYEKALANGALGGKLLGAGGGGFLLLYCDQARQEALKEKLNELTPMPFRFDWGGARIIYVGDRNSESGFVMSRA